MSLIWLKRLISVRWSTFGWRAGDNLSIVRKQPSLVGGFNPFEKYARQNGFIFPFVFRGENSKNLWVATTQQLDKLLPDACEPGSKLVVLGMVIQPLIGILIMGPYKPLRTWVDEFIPYNMEIMGVDRPDRTCMDYKHLHLASTILHRLSHGIFIRRIWRSIRREFNHPSLGIYIARVCTYIYTYYPNHLLIR